MNDPFVHFPREDVEQSVPALFEGRVERWPSRLAIKGRRHALTYRALDQEADRLAHAIVARRGHGAETIALIFEHDAPAIVAILGVLKAGKTYVGLDPRHPPTRLARILEDSEAPLLVAGAGFAGLARTLVASSGCAVLEAEALDPAAPAGRLGMSVDPAAPACICYTGGSTGEPKGVVLDHRGLLHRAMTYVNSARIGPDDRLSLLHSTSVTASFRQMYGALLTGAAVYPFDLGHDGLAGLGAWLRAERITACHLAASVFRHFAGALTDADAFPALRALWIANEPVFRSDVDLYRARFADHCVFANSLGISEAGNVREYVLDKATPLEGDLLPIGYAVPDKEILLLDAEGREAPPGEEGEIAVRSEYLALGYWRRPELERQVFLPDPAGGPGRIYRTGDLGRMRPDGCLLHLGRKDGRPKLRGHFVDSLEVERRLLMHAGLTGAVVAVREDQPGNPRLVAYVVPAAGAAPTAGELRQFAQSTLPEHMVPSVWVALAALPQTPNGKVDRRALPAPGRERLLGTVHVAPRSPIEREVARIWARVLGLDEVGIEDDFLELGGHSLLAARIIAEVRQAFGVEAPAQALLEARRVADMATVILECLLSTAEPELRERFLADPA